MSNSSSERTQELLRQQTTLARFGELALKCSDLGDILSEACRLVGETLKTDLAKVMELQPDGETLLVRAGVGWKPGVVGEVTVQASETTSEGHALRCGKPIISCDIEKETRFKYPQFLTDNGVKALVNVPILGGDHRPPFGILQVDSRKARRFTEDDTAFLSGYANLLAAAVDRLRVLHELRESEQRLRESIGLHQAALQTGLIGFFEWDVAKQTITADEHFAGFYALDVDRAAAGVPLAELFELIHPEDRAMVKANVEGALAAGSDYQKSFRLVHPDGAVRWVSVRSHCTERDSNGRPLRYAGTAVDVTDIRAAEAVLRQVNDALEIRVADRTRELVEANSRLRTEAEERERIEEQLRQAHKMEAVGQLTGGLAHDFNNLLAGVSGSLQLIRTRAAQGRVAEIERYLEAALTSTSRAASLTHRLLAFSRRQTLAPKPTDANGLVTGMDELVRRTVGPAVEVELRLASDLWSTLCDPNQLESALLNLAINARDAMPEGGRLAFETANVEITNRAGGAEPHPAEVPPGQYVALRVTDTGAGMTPDVRARAFDPFFTTKPLGQGTGLGLSMIYGFVQQSGGHVRLRSAPGDGTMVTLFLPRWRVQEGGVPEAPAERRKGASANGGGNVILAVEDEPAVRMVVVDVLSSLGYKLLEAENARAGLGVLESGARIDLLLTDVGLPGGMNGRQLADAARAIRPDLKVLFVTGYADAAAVGNGLLAEGMDVMTKPFDLDVLAAKVQGIIGN